MNTPVTETIEIPEEFRIACVLQFFEPEKVLQFFIDQISFLCTLYQGYIPGYTQATMVTSEYSVKIHSKLMNGDGRPINFQNRELAIKCIKQIAKIGLEKGQTAEKKRKKSLPVVNSLYKAIGNYRYCPEEVYLNAESVIHFSKDFRIICELHHCYPKAYLEHFMNKISIAEDQARKALKIAEENSSMQFFNLLEMGLGNLRPQTIKMTKALMHFIDEAQEIHPRHFIIRDLNKRIAAYRDFYKAHYLNILKENQQS